MVVLPDVDDLHVKHLGIDEHRCRRVRWHRDPDTSAWRRVEPWMTTLVNTASGQVLGVVDGRDSATVEAWLAARSPEWRARIEIVAIDPSAAFRKAITTCLPAARIAVDPFHLVQLANLAVTRVRQRLIQEHAQRRGRRVDPAWAHRMLLLRGYDTLTPSARHRLDQVFATDDPTGELGAAWGVKEGLRLVLACRTLTDAATAGQNLVGWVAAADTPETDRLWATLTVWWSAIEVFITSRVTNFFKFYGYN